jgi:D-galactose 1-dehydrogenase
MIAPVRIGLVGVGKIARDQHLPALAANPAFELVAAASRDFVEGATPGSDRFARHATIEAMLDAHPEIDAVVLCTPPQVRHDLARLALERGKHVFLEKPPGATLSEVEALATEACQSGLTLFAGWHSRFAPAVEPARLWLAERRLRKVRIDWREDVRRWHPGQAWVWQAGGLGVFDPGINALSIATAILPRPFFLTSAELRFPGNCDAPVAADLSFRDESGLAIEAGFDWLQTGPQTWDIRVDTEDGQLLLSHGGAVMSIDGRVTVDTPEAEYPGLYERFATLIAAGASEVDVSPLRHVADAFMLGRRVTTKDFHE